MPDAPTSPQPVPLTRPTPVRGVRTRSAAVVVKHKLHSVYRGADGQVRHDLSPAELTDAVRSASGTVWADIDSGSAEHRELIASVFGVHPLHVEDVGNPQSRVKVEDLPGRYVIVVARVVRFCETTDDPYDVETTNLNVLIGPNWVITAHAGESPSVMQAADIFRRNPDLLERGPARIGHMVLDAAVDAYFPLLDNIASFVDVLEDRVFVRCEQDVLPEIFALKRLVLSLRRYLAPQREVFGVLSNRPSQVLPADVQVYFRDVYDHVLRINDELDNYRELLSGVLDGYLSQVNNRLGQVTKGLSVVATLSLPFVVVSGMWGMNFHDIPLSAHEHGFWIMVVVQLALGGGLVATLRHNKLL